MDAYGLCGARYHYLTLDNRQINPGDFSSFNKVVDPWLEFEYFPNGDPATAGDIAVYNEKFVGGKKCLDRT